jgi:putative ATPase
MSTPLSEQLRPQTLEEVIGQDHIVGTDGFITSVIQRGKPLSLLLWGPPGSGKTSIARLYAQAFSLPFETMSAIFSGVADLKKRLVDAKQPILLFVDEIHRFNKAQQDAFLPFLENGTLVLIGATVENPSFYLNNALLSRMRVLKLNSLTEHDLAELVRRYETKKGALALDDEARRFLIHLAQGDGRFIYNLIENIQGIERTSSFTVQELERLFQKKSPLFDKSTDQHYNLISALHKAVRGSDPDASLYWFCRIIHGGEDPLFLARRIIRMASEDVGLADPQALPLAIAAKDAYEMLGSPEGELALAEAVVYLALAPKSNAIYTAYKAALKQAQETAHLDPPYIILNAPTKVMKDLGYSKGYIYDHDAKDAFSGQNYFPDRMKREEYYTPVERGFEREMKKRIEYFRSLRKKLQN